MNFLAIENVIQTKAVRNLLGISIHESHDNPCEDAFNNHDLMHKSIETFFHPIRFECKS